MGKVKEAQLGVRKALERELQAKKEKGVEEEVVCQSAEAQVESVL